MTSRPGGDLISAPLPAALKILVAKARAKIKQADSLDPASSVTVHMGAAEIRAVYSLSTQLHAAREQRDKYKAEIRRLNGDVDRVRADVRDHALLNDRGVIALLTDIERVLSGEEPSERATGDALDRVRGLIRRARKKDRAASRG